MRVQLPSTVEEKVPPQAQLYSPYHENRAVIFNSNLFHQTDNLDFKDGYENRRINVTMLFGTRES